MNQEMINVINSVIQDRCYIEAKDPEAWVIIFKGERLTLESGKSVWKKQQYAKAAFTSLIRDHAVYLYHDNHNEIDSWKEMVDIYDAEIERMIKDGILEFKKL